MARIEGPTTRWTLRLGLILAASVPAIAYSYPDVPYIASSGDLIEARDINDNFEHVIAGINELEQRVVPAGSIVPFAGETPPPGWLLCDGSVVLSEQHPDLFAAIGTAHGEGIGPGTFHLPDLRGRFLRGVDLGSGTDPDVGARNAPNVGGNSGDAVGSIQGSEMGAHTHGLSYRASTGPTGGVGYIAGAGINNHPGGPNQSANGIGFTGGNETRPINAYVHWIIRT